MMGGDSGTQEDMFAKLESMRAVITEVNSQFKDPVRISHLSYPTLISHCLASGKDNLRLCLHIRVLVPLRDRTSCTRAHDIRDRHA